MHCVPVNILLAFVSHSECMANENLREFFLTGVFDETLVERILHSSPLRRSDLRSTTLAKPGVKAILPRSGQTRLALAVVESCASCKKVFTCRKRYPGVPRRMLEEQRRRRRTIDATENSTERENETFKVGPHDVLTLKGNAAQSTTHQGNLEYYALCEEKYDRWVSIGEKNPERRKICEEIAQRVLDAGGVFRDAALKPQSLHRVIDKIKNRFRQIMLPKKAPDMSQVSEHDVVVALGAASWVYEGNKFWWQLCDEAFEKYWAIDEQQPKRILRRRFHKEEEKHRIMGEIVQQVYDRGGVFRSGNQKVMSRKEAILQTQRRFSDLKKTARKHNSSFHEMWLMMGHNRSQSRAGLTLTKSTVPVGPKPKPVNKSISTSDHAVKKRIWRAKRRAERAKEDTETETSSDSELVFSSDTEALDRDDQADAERRRRTRALGRRRRDRRRSLSAGGNFSTKRKTSAKKLGTAKNEESEASCSSVFLDSTSQSSDAECEKMASVEALARPKKKQRQNEPEELSSYELMRLERIKQNKELSLKLGLNQASSNRLTGQTQAKHRVDAKHRHRHRDVQLYDAVLRRSSRNRTSVHYTQYLPSSDDDCMGKTKNQRGSLSAENAH
eukprot:gnl/MRDRNA2_/MRDRNA2_77737_c0_seq1.p1 gnl/MRDRNA2_/MRDRNA2_77737_c0~~gnl/MRDRNA2_/MRDRNA2_77737_c0_seq1.p1  ORF type:complete len:615 (+),score=96.64 gnl/MRDRNA2_/MRDRNA2_77737_c0_seq1:138-1982(+)